MRTFDRRFVGSALVILVGTVVAAPSALAVPGDIALASISDSGAKADNGGTLASVSADGTRVAFFSVATNLDPSDPDGLGDIYVKDLTTGDLTLASTSDTGVKGNGSSFEPAISADGTKVAFSTEATNLDPADTDSLGDVYVKDLTTGDITLASTNDAGVKGNVGSGGLSLSADGTKVVFMSLATNFDPTDTDGFWDLYVKDITTGDITLASTGDAGAKGNDNSIAPSISADGTRVAFESNATNFDPVDSEFPLDVYVKDLVTGSITIASTDDAGLKGDGVSFQVSLSGDGNRVAFMSNATNLDPANTDGFQDVYVKDLTTGDITLASTDDAGVKGNSSSFDPSISADGTRVAFDSQSTNLEPTDPDDVIDVFVKDLETGDITLASTDDAGVKGNGQSFFPSLSADGSRVGFQSIATNLDPADTDADEDVYVKEFGAAPGTDLLVVKADDPDPVRQGQSLTFSLTVASRGTDAATGVRLTDTLPAGVTFASASPSQGSCSELGGVVTCELGNMAGGAFAAVEIVVTPNEPGVVTNRAEITSEQTDTHPTNNVDTEDTTVLAAPSGCTISGTEGNDVLRGTRRDDVICGLGGDDKLDGGRGNDLLLANEGRDQLDGGSGADVLRGGDGNDLLRTLDGVRGNDTADGGEGFDRCRVDPGDVVVSCP